MFLLWVGVSGDFLSVVRERDVNTAVLVRLVRSIGVSGVAERVAQSRGVFWFRMAVSLIIASWLVQYRHTSECPPLLARTLQIFCTEPYRVPMAGKVDVCLFDKTGTLTTDELVAVGVEAPNPSGNEGIKTSGRDGRSSVMDTLVTMLEAPPAATLVLAGCQSLVLMEGSEAGDPVEAAAMKSIKVSHFFGSPFVGSGVLDVEALLPLVTVVWTVVTHRRCCNNLEHAVMKEEYGGTEAMSCVICFSNSCCPPAPVDKRLRVPNLPLPRCAVAPSPPLT